jgi:hypothetical protein
MTDADKIVAFDRVAQIIDDQMALEKHMLRRKSSYSAIEFIRADAYHHIVNVAVGLNALLLLGIGVETEAATVDAAAGAES